MIEEKPPLAFEELRRHPWRIALVLMLAAGCWVGIWFIVVVLWALFGGGDP